MEHRQTDRQIASSPKQEKPVARLPYTHITLTHKTYVQGHVVTRQLRVSVLPDQQTCMQKNTYITVKTYLGLSKVNTNQQELFYQIAKEIKSKAADGVARLGSEV